jgi:hypothetical protein
MFTSLATAVADPQELDSQEERRRQWDKRARWHRAQSGSGNLVCNIDGLRYALSIRKSRRRGWPSWWGVGVAEGGGEIKWLPPRSSLALAKAAARSDYCRRTDTELRAEQAVGASTQTQAPTPQPADWRLGFDDLFDSYAWLLDCGGFRFGVDKPEPIEPGGKWRWRAYDDRRTVFVSPELFATADDAKADAEMVAVVVGPGVMLEPTHR